MAENVSKVDFEKLTQAMTELAILMLTSFQDLCRSMTTGNREHRYPVDLII